MSKLLKSKVFIGTFLLIYFSFFVVTIYVLDIRRDGIGVGHIAYGFPFTYYYSSCFGGDYLWSGLIGNILAAAVLSFVGGLSFAHLRTKISAPEFQTKFAEFRAKWYL